MDQELNEHTERQQRLADWDWLEYLHYPLRHPPEFHNASRYTFVESWLQWANSRLWNGDIKPERQGMYTVTSGVGRALIYTTLFPHLQRICDLLTVTVREQREREREQRLRAVRESQRRERQRLEREMRETFGRDWRHADEPLHGNLAALQRKGLI